MEQLDSYKKEKLTINLVWANVFGILIIIPIVLLYGLPYYLIWGSSITIQSLKDTISGISSVHIGIGVLLFLLIITFGVILHELIHGLTWARYTEKGLKSMKFGVFWTMLTPYCHCKEPLQVRQYILGAITPAIFLGLIPAIISIIIGNLGLLVFGIFFTVAAGGDFLIINLLRKEKMDNLVQDHPTEAGCFVYRKK